MRIVRTWIIRRRREAIEPPSPEPAGAGKTVVARVGIKGDKGEPGDPAAPADPGDLTLIFDNRLI